jgi:hypothetical protein
MRGLIEGGFACDPLLVGQAPRRHALRVARGRRVSPSTTIVLPVVVPLYGGGKELYDPASGRDGREREPAFMAAFVARALGCSMKPISRSRLPSRGAFRTLLAAPHSWNHDRKACCRCRHSVPPWRPESMAAACCPTSSGHAKPPSIRPASTASSVPERHDRTAGRPRCMTSPLRQSSTSCGGTR